MPLFNPKGGVACPPTETNRRAAGVSTREMQAGWCAGAPPRFFLAWVCTDRVAEVLSLPRGTGSRSATPEEGALAFVRNGKPFRYSGKSSRHADRKNGMCPTIFGTADVNAGRLSITAEGIAGGFFLGTSITRVASFDCYCIMS